MSGLWRATEERTKDIDLVFAGRGLKSTGLAGAYSVLEERGYTPKTMAGASASTIIAGYVATDLRETMLPGRL